MTAGNSMLALARRVPVRELLLLPHLRRARHSRRRLRSRRSCSSAMAAATRSLRACAPARTYCVQALQTIADEHRAWIDSDKMPEGKLPMSASTNAIFGNRLVIACVAVASIAGWATPARSQLSAASLPVDQTTRYKGEEYLLIGDAVRGAGEPVIAINPKNPDNIIVGAMANLHYVEGSPFGATQAPVGPDTILKYRNTPEASISRYAISEDRGRTWRHIEDPFRRHFDMNGTADAFVGAAPDGTLFMGSMSFFPRNASPEILAQEREPEPALLFGGTTLTWSQDQGRTWNHPPVMVMGLDTPIQEYGPGLKPLRKFTTPFDRPYLVSDLSTGTIYVPGTGLGGDPPRRQTFVRASKDNGKTWGLIYSIDSPLYPQSAFGAGRPAAAHGVLGVTYIASSAPSVSTGECPCLIFGASRDEGRTFERHVVRTGLPADKGFEEGMGPPVLPMVAADPSRAGRFAVMLPAADESGLLVLVTDDYGITWKGPVRAGGTRGTKTTKPDITYSPRGELALIWLAVNPDHSYAAWSSVSHDGGLRFSPSLKVSRSASPPRSAIRFRGNNWDGDDLSSLAVDNEFVHLVWADGRAGFLGAWYARIPLSSY
jgi:hypothetical protein